MNGAYTEHVWRYCGCLMDRAPIGGITCMDSNGWLANTGWFYATNNDAIYMLSNNIGLMEWHLYGYLADTVPGGLSCLAGYTSITSAFWYFATRLSCNGNRGE